MMGDSTEIREGKVKINKASAVFYNKVQEFNRDLSVLGTHTYLKNELWRRHKKPAVKDEVTILDALSATGLRSVRYSLECTECPLPIKVIANDILEPAIEQIKDNISTNDAKNVEVNHDDASMFMYKRKASNDRITVIDLDPYGSPAPFLDSAIQAIADGGLLMVTCTDMAVLAGNHGEKCYALYGSFPVKAKFCHEMALRILLHSVQSHANRYGRYIVPLLSLSIDFYIRIFIQVFTSPLEARKSTSKQSYIYICNVCESFRLQPMTEDRSKDNSAIFVPAKVQYDSKCSLCSNSIQIGGPIWSAPIHDPEFVKLMKTELERKQNDFGTHRRMAGILELVDEELNDVPLYYQLDRLCSLASCTCPPIRVFRSAILNAGYRVSYAHSMKNSVKTDAPNDLIWAIIKRLLTERNEKPKELSRAYPILIKDFSNINISLDAAENAEPESKNKRLLRYQINPENYWGPKSRPGCNDSDKRERNQGKHTTKRIKLDDSETTATAAATTTTTPESS